MSAQEIEISVREISPETPCGPSLADTPAFVEIDRLVQGVPERQVGTAILPAQEPDWRRLRQLCVEYLTRSKDLRVAISLTVALLKLEGLPGFRDGLAILRTFTERYWDQVHPRLNPDDDLDPAERVNILSQLAIEGVFGDTLILLKRLREAPLCESAQWGRPSLRDILIARGELKIAAAPGAPPSMTVESIRGAFADCPEPLLQSVRAAATEAAEHVKGIEAVFNARVGQIRAPDLGRLSKTLAEITTALQQFAGDRVKAPPAGIASSATAEGQIAHAEPQSNGAIRTKRDVQLALERICQYFEEHEPSSPIPLLLKGAQRLLPKNFMEIMKCLDANSLACLMSLSGEKEDPKKPAK